MKKIDYILFATTVCIIGILAIIWSISFSNVGNSAVIMINNTVIYECSLNNESIVVISEGVAKQVADINTARTMIESSKGSNLVVIKDGYVFVEAADCPDKICVHMEPINEIGKSIVCMPNKMVVTVK